MLLPGAVVAGYRVERVLGAGGMGVVYLVANPELSRRVYQARDAEHAQRLAGSLADTAANSPTSKPAAPVPGLPQSRCVLTDDTGGLLPRLICFTSVGRYCVGADSAQSATAYQQMAAQYHILAGS